MSRNVLALFGICFLAGFTCDNTQVKAVVEQGISFMPASVCAADALKISDLSALDCDDAELEQVTRISLSDHPALEDFSQLARFPKLQLLLLPARMRFSNARMKSLVDALTPAAQRQRIEVRFHSLSADFSPVRFHNMTFVDTDTCDTIRNRALHMGLIDAQEAATLRERDECPLFDIESHDPRIVGHMFCKNGLPSTEL